jgi:hypothetical protein
MTWTFDERLNWREHFLRYGFCRLRGIIAPEVCAAALDEVHRLVDDPRPLAEWSTDRPGQRYSVYYAGEAPAVDALSYQSGLVSTLDVMFGAVGFHHGSMDPTDPNRRRVALWVNPFDADARPRLQRMGHIDSGDPRRGVAYHIALADTSPFSGNTTYFPGTHHAMLEWLAANPDPTWPGGVYPEVPRALPPWEFIAQAGDVVIAHHMLFHSANPSHAADRQPRVAIRVEVFAQRAPSIAAPTSLFERSLLRDQLDHRSKM